MIRAYKFLMRPTVGQTVALGEMLRDHCSLYNGALQERRDAYRHSSKTSVRYGQQSAQLKAIRAFDPERHGRWSFSSQQATLRRLDKAFNFVPNPRHGRTDADRLAAAQQALSRFPRVRRDKRTANHRRAVEKVAKLHGKVLDLRCRMGGVPHDPHRQGCKRRAASDRRGPPQHLQAVP